MTNWGRCDYYIPPKFNGGMVFCGRDPGEQEVRHGTPLYPEAPAGRILAECCVEAGISREDVAILNVSRNRPPGNKFEAHSRESLDAEIRHLHATLDRLKPRVIVTLGNEAAHAIIEGWPDGRDRDGFLTHRGNIKSASDIEQRRGFVFDTRWGPTVATVHPASVARDWTPWRVLLSYDIQRAKEILRDGLVRPTRIVEVVGSDRDSRHAIEALRRHRVLSADIENDSETRLSCIGLAGEGGRSFVFPAQHAQRAKELLESPRITSVWVNGIYDLFVLKHREGWRIPGRVEDALIGWHACYPEIAGAKEDPKKRRFTRKALSFLASLVTFDPWWKCLHEDTPVLMADLSWKALKAVNVGDDVVAFTEHTQDHRKRTWQVARVLGKKLQIKECLKVKTTCGDLIGTPCHRVLATKLGGRKGWYRLDELTEGSCLHFLNRWEASRTFDAGWLSGFADGEGTIRRSLHQQTGAALTIAQKQGPLLNKAKEIAEALGFDVRIHSPNNNTSSLYFAGGTRALFKALGMFQPGRLVNNFVSMLRSGLVSMRTEQATILSIEKVGEMPVGDIATSNGTFVADGFAVHNSYKFARPEDQFLLNGRDVCITMDVWIFMQAEMRRVGAEAIYEHERSLMWPCVDMLQRGLHVNEKLRLERLEKLQARIIEEEARANALVLPLLEREATTLEALGVSHLFEETDGVCPCCRHAKKKQARCWSCAGFEKAPSKAEMLARATQMCDAGNWHNNAEINKKIPKENLELIILGVCRVCGGAPRETRRVVSLNSNAQAKIILYDLLKVPKRFKRNTKGESVLTTDEEALRGLMGSLSS